MGAPGPWIPCCSSPLPPSPLALPYPTPALAAEQLDGEEVQPPRPLPWYPEELAWQMDFSRNQLRKLSWLADIHEYVKQANSSGAITRQEAVSMVPPLFMDVQPHHRVRQGRTESEGWGPVA